MKKNRSTTFALALGIVFLVVVIGGRYVVGTPVTKMLPPASPASQDSSSAQTKNIPDSQTTHAEATDTNSTALSCTETLRGDVASKKESYAKGQILVTFKKDQTYQDSKNTLAVYGLVIQNENNSQASFSARHLVTAAVAPSQEITKVCLLRNDSHIVFAGLDLYFGLHE